MLEILLRNLIILLLQIKKACGNQFKQYNKTISEKQLEDEVLKDVFETYWERFIKRYDEIIKNSRPEEHIKKRTNEEILNEILTTVRAIDKRSQINDMLNSSSKYIMQYDNLESSLKPNYNKKDTRLFKYDK